LIYNWRTERWARATVSCELIFGGVSQQGYTLEQLDPFGTVDTLPYSLDSSFWTGKVSLLLFAFDTGHKSGSFSGPALAPPVETGEFKPPQRPPAPGRRGPAPRGGGHPPNA